MTVEEAESCGSWKKRGENGGFDAGPGGGPISGWREKSQLPENAQREKNTGQRNGHPFWGPSTRHRGGECGHDPHELFADLSARELNREPVLGAAVEVDAGERQKKVHRVRQPVMMGRAKKIGYDEGA